MKISKLLGATAIASVIAMPAMAQTVIDQFTNENFTSPFSPGFTTLMQLNQAGGFDYPTDPGSVPLNINTLNWGQVYDNVDTTTSRNSVSEVVQIATGNLNVVAPGEITGNFVIRQGAGNYFNPTADGGLGDDVYGNTVVSIVNANGLWTENPLFSSTLVAGSQIGQINVNTVNTVVDANATGNLWQQAGTDGSFLGLQPVIGFPAGPVLSVDNWMVAITQNGTADVTGRMIDPDAEGDTPVFKDGGIQAAIVNLNNASFELGTRVTLNLSGGVGQLGVLQELTANNSIAVRNVAAAVALENGDATVDPSVTNLDQTAVANINGLSFSTAVVGVSDGVNQYGAATVNLNGAQFAFGQDLPIFGEGQLYVRLGNVAAAVAGVPDLGESLNSTDFWTGELNSGTVRIENVAQVAALQINTISNPIGNADADKGAVGNVSVNLTGPLDIESIKLPTQQSAFAQIFSGADLTIVPVEIGGNDNVNLMVAATGAGMATIADASQAFVINVNSVNIGSTLSGGLVQNAYNVGEDTENYYFENRALALVQGGNGAASINGLTQVMQQSYNTVSAGTLNDFYLNQLATDVRIGNSNNAQVSAGGAASINNLIQLSSLNVNTVSTNNLIGVGSVINQSSSNVSMSSVNTINVSGLTNTVNNAVQQSSISLNTIGVK